VTDNIAQKVLNILNDIECIPGERLLEKNSYRSTK